MPIHLPRGLGQLARRLEDLLPLRRRERRLARRRPRRGASVARRRAAAVRGGAATVRGGAPPTGRLGGSSSGSGGGGGGSAAVADGVERRSLLLVQRGDLRRVRRLRIRGLAMQLRRRARRRRRRHPLLLRRGDVLLVRLRRRGVVARKASRELRLDRRLVRAAGLVQALVRRRVLGRSGGGVVARARGVVRDRDGQALGWVGLGCRGPGGGWRNVTPALAARGFVVGVWGLVVLHFWDLRLKGIRRIEVVGEVEVEGHVRRGRIVATLIY